MQMIGLQATKLYLQTQEAYFSGVFFYSFSSVLIFLYFSPNLNLRFFSKCLCLAALEVMTLHITHLWIVVVYNDMYSTVCHAWI